MYHSISRTCVLPHSYFPQDSTASFSERNVIQPRRLRCRERLRLRSHAMRARYDSLANQLLLQHQQLVVPFICALYRIWSRFPDSCILCFVTISIIPLVCSVSGGVCPVYDVFWIAPSLLIVRDFSCCGLRLPHCVFRSWLPFLDPSGFCLAQCR